VVCGGEEDINYFFVFELTTLPSQLLFVLVLYFK